MPFSNPFLTSLLVNLHENLPLISFLLPLARSWKERAFSARLSCGFPAFGTRFMVFVSIATGL